MIKRGLMIAVLLGSWLIFSAVAVHGQAGNRAGLIVVGEDGTAVTRCVPFDEPTLSSYDLLSRSGLDIDVSVSGQGVTVCQIEATGCPIDDCWCQCRGGGECRYWSSWHWVDGAWQYAVVGAHAYQVSAGDVDGWVWGVGSVTAAPQPPTLSFAEICSAEGLGEEPTAVSAPSAPLAWLGYAILGLIVVGLLGLLWRRQ